MFFEVGEKIRRILALLNYAFHYFLGFDERTCIPKGVYKSCKKWWIARRKKLGAQVEYNELSSGYTVERFLPRTVEPEIHKEFIKNTTHTYPPTFVVRFSHGRVYRSQTAIISPEGFLLEDVSSWANSNVHPILKRIKRLEEPTFLPGRVAVMSKGSSTYYHWMYDILPRYSVLAESGWSPEDFDYFVFRDSVDSPFKQESLKKIGIKQDQVATLQQNPHYMCNDLVVPSFPSVTFHPPNWAITYLRELFLTGCSFGQSNKRLYISRARASARRVVNESEVEDFLASVGFEAIWPETMSVAEQATIFNSAAVIVSPHGAGMSNIAFCSSATVVIECFSSHYINTCYWVLSNWLNLRYFYIMDDADVTDSSLEKDVSVRNSSDMRIPLYKLSATLREAGLI